MNVTVKPNLQARIEEKLRKGEFASADDLVEQALMFFLEYEDGEMDADEFLETQAAVDEALLEAERGEGTSLEEFDQTMRVKYGIPR